MNKEQKTILAIQKAVPDILELKFGCRIVNQANNLSQKFDNTIVGSKIIGTNRYPVSYSTSVDEDQIIEIIGRPITLEDCLIAIFEKYNARTDWEQGSAMEFDTELLQLIQGLWIFGKPFTEQSKETKELIGDLILKK